ncbi:MAG: methyltransferase domain-containing protein [Saprospiraceae bacterium]|nr:methyltransferase domain-containing protein [Saprospiraceae bacterium]
MQQLLGEEFPAFQRAMQEAPPVSIRYNRAKWPDAPVADPVPWHPDGAYLPERPVFTLDPLFQAGAYYVQEASSMFLYEALRQTVDFGRSLRVLDLCAAPGGKSTLLASMLSPDSLLVANEVIRQRVSVLRENLEKWGLPNIAVSCADTDDFAALEGWFDVVVADAPCSGEGLFRKDPAAFREWSPASVDLCVARQKRILANAATALAPGGVLAYSTCTFNRQEDEEQIDWLRRSFGLEPLRLDLPADWGITAADGGYRFFPHRVRGEGFFIAVLRKTEGHSPKQQAGPGFKMLQALPKKLAAEPAAWLRPDAEVQFFQTTTGDVLALPAPQLPTYQVLDKLLKSKWFGVNTGAFKGKDFVPAHGLASSILANPALPGVDFSREQAQLFLKKEVFELPAGAPTQGWALARFSGLNLGWMKILPNRWNNYLPPERRIRMEI